MAQSVGTFPSTGPAALAGKPSQTGQVPELHIPGTWHYICALSSSSLRTYLPPMEGPWLDKPFMPSDLGCLQNWLNTQGRADEGSLASSSASHPSWDRLCITQMHKDSKRNAFHRDQATPLSYVATSIRSVGSP